MQAAGVVEIMNSSCDIPRDMHVPCLVLLCLNFSAFNQPMDVLSIGIIVCLLKKQSFIKCTFSVSTKFSFEIGYNYSVYKYD